MLGYELEFLGANLRNLRYLFHTQVYPSNICLPDYNTFHLKEEYQVTDKLYNGGELVSPIYENLEECIQNLDEPLEILKNAGAFIPVNSENVGFHIHYQNNFLHTNEQKQYFILFLYAFQAEIFEIARGREVRMRSCINPFAMPLYYDQILQIQKLLLNRTFTNKVWCFLFCERLNTVEFRYFNSSLKTEVLKSYLYLVEGICKYFKHFSSVDLDMIRYYAYKQRDDITEVLEDRKRKLQQIIKNVA